MYFRTALNYKHKRGWNGFKLARMFTYSRLANGLTRFSCCCYIWRWYKLHCPFYGLSSYLLSNFFAKFERYWRTFPNARHLHAWACRSTKLRLCRRLCNLCLKPGWAADHLILVFASTSGTQSDRQSIGYDEWAAVCMDYLLQCREPEKFQSCVPCRSSLTILKR